MTDKNRQLITRFLALAAVIAISIFIYSKRNEAEELKRYGYPGVLVISFMAYATVLLPAPGVALIAAAGTVLNPLWVGMVAGLGAAGGELVGYAAGYSGQGLAAKAKTYERLVSLTNRFGLWVVFFLSAIPNPVFDLAGAAAGTLKMRILPFFLACWAGETVKMLLFAYGGARLLGLFT